MSAASALRARVEPWLLELLARHDAVLEPQVDGSTFVCLPEALQQHLGLPEAAALRVLEPARASEVAVTLEGAVIQGCLDLALARGGIAAGRIDVPSRKHDGLHAAAAPALQVDNAALRPAETRRIDLRWLLLEFGWVATADERATGSVFVAHEPRLGLTSTPFASTVLTHLSAARPAADLPQLAEIEAVTSTLANAIDASVRAAVAPFARGTGERFAKELRRLSAYYDKLLVQAGRARGRAASDPEARAGKRAAVERDRDEKRKELAARFAVRCEVQVASALALTHEGALAEFVVRRRTRERTVAVAWDPWTRAPLPLACEACGSPTRTFHACDDAVHLVCSKCRSPRCPRCAAKR